MMLVKSLIFVVSFHFLHCVVTGKFNLILFYWGCRIDITNFIICLNCLLNSYNFGLCG